MATNNTNRPADKATLTRNPEGWRYRSTVNNGIPWNETTLELSHGATDYELEIAAGEAFPSDKGIPLTIDRPKTSDLDRACEIFNKDLWTDSEKADFRAYLRAHRCEHEGCHAAKVLGVFCVEHDWRELGRLDAIDGRPAKFEDGPYALGYSSGTRAKLGDDHEQGRGISEQDQARRRLERLQNDYADWRSGERASAGCPATSERYALRMRLACRDIDRKIVTLMDEYPEIQEYPGQVDRLRAGMEFGY